MDWTRSQFTLPNLCRGNFNASSDIFPPVHIYSLSADFPFCFHTQAPTKEGKDMTDMERRQYHLSLRMHRHMVMGIEVPSDTDASSPNEDW